ncbi:Abi family protein [Thalassolituus oleivorans]|uniref:Abi-like protein n=1 Tax=Thalassolituus oleivorans MIL-1 TaxID=1298593 RepID=M5DY55_9GAMM|nr:Abi family protein [Thalassolituus oleivorans]CCU70454.1 hypothetical protein TOL_0005 [Thalassolituus oleivorans MIL-1]
MPYRDIEKVLSPGRLFTYRNAVKTILGVDSEDITLKLYEWNAKLSGHFLFPLHIYEVMLRNAISDAISQRYGLDWPVNTVFQNSLPKKEKADLLNLVTPTYDGLGKVVPELNLYWFESMLTQRHEARIWKPYSSMTFPNASVDAANLRVILNKECKKIRKLRNRIAHHEPIFNQANMQEILGHIQTAVAFRCTTTEAWLMNCEQVSELLINPII